MTDAVSVFGIVTVAQMSENSPAGFVAAVLFFLGARIFDRWKAARKEKEQDKITVEETKQIKQLLKKLDDDRRS